ncbi:hypothetical protein [Vibrio nigripulchritudo]|uniref:hypothetical protein n=1 Tax=Vibrio nigripulchritudo TaxID=28173 RepID=UPI0005FA3B46|nr:hypothetical protein [Vibrio nigripulchritudo]KJY72078.1 hypothetical protein TW74_22365 [Vibrio nigripulchritudo]
MIKIDKNNHDLLSLCVAAIAVLLSQFQPIYKYFESYELRIQKISSIQIHPNPNGGISLSLRPVFGNSGQEKGIIHDLTIVIDNDSSYSYSASDIKFPKQGEMMFNHWLEYSPQTIEPDSIWAKTLRFTSRQLSDDWSLLLKNSRQALAEDRKMWCEDNYPACEYMNGKMYFPPSNIIDNYIKGIFKEHSWLKAGKHEIAVIYEMGGIEPEEYRCDLLSFEIDRIDIKFIEAEMVSAIDGQSNMSFDTIRPDIPTEFIRSCEKNYISDIFGQH